MDKQIGRESR
ncbi:hypothetical protein BIW11_04410 [Tropilaelaps mercedesae]|uniref:Uncharacterized protein n=1 Tax=Tropilaelaps mercedesae TaxID=418985 RepID=A0A1V9X7G9_9ACAR|nr:hypothetical protein BIW11_04410 [Tropilaelaps mercedesae]